MLHKIRIISILKILLSEFCSTNMMCYHSAEINVFSAINVCRFAKHSWIFCFVSEVSAPHIFFRLVFLSLCMELLALQVFTIVTYVFEQFTWCCFGRVMPGFLVIFLHEVTQLTCIAHSTDLGKGAVVIGRLGPLHEVIASAFLQSTTLFVTCASANTGSAADKALSKFIRTRLVLWGPTEEIIWSFAEAPLLPASNV